MEIQKCDQPTNQPTDILDGQVLEMLAHLKKKKMRYPPFNFNYYAANDNYVLDCMAQFIDQVDYDFH